MVRWIKQAAKCNNIDKVIYAELPHPNLYPKLFKVVKSYMIHGPCGVAKLNSPCMKQGKCSKKIPKKFTCVTTIYEDGYPIYKRRNNGIFVEKNGIQMDNSNVVPYSHHLLMRYQAHVNTKYCNKSNSIKYLFKYVNKRPDRATMKIINGSTEDVDEIKNYYDCRYLSLCEAVWRTFGFDIHHRWPVVQKFSFHLPKQQSILFKDNDNLDQVFQNNEFMKTMCLDWLDANNKYVDGRNLTYVEFLTKFVWIATQRQ